jgi:hypothetical protein
MFLTMRKCRELLYRVLVTHRPVALGADGPEVVDVRRATLALRDVVANLKLKRRHDVLTPRHEALVFKEAVSAPQKPYLLTERARDFRLH